MDTIKLEIVTPVGMIFSQDVKTVTLPGSEGEFGVLPGHASLVSLLKAGVIEIEMQDKRKEVVAINWGYAKVDEQKITVLADGAVAIVGDTESEIASSLQKAKKLIESIKAEDAAMASTLSKIESAARSK